LTPSLTTARLILRPLEPADSEQIQALFPQWEIVRYLARVVPWPYPPDGARTFIEKIALPAAGRSEEWDWTLRLKTNPDALIGAIGLVRAGETNRGFWIAPQWQGQGLMTEAAEAVTDYWFDVLKFPLLRVTKAVENVASSRITAKQGMRLVGVKESEYVCGRLKSEIWEITAEEWRERRRHQK
jgi:[ribosomal protein S5]-alanine N-acetyltransferase